MQNTYSPLWFQLFLETQQSTEDEVAFLRRQLPYPMYTRILDVCCGQGRHTTHLAAAGYHMTGIDMDTNALAIAQAQTTLPTTYHQHDMRHLTTLPGEFDAIICLWQSFGFFDDDTNVRILADMRAKLRPAGRLILDVYHREFFAVHQGVRRFERQGVAVTATTTVQGNRLTSHLHYGGNQGEDTFNWQVFTPEELCHLAATTHLHCHLTCTAFQEARPACPSHPRMQFVFERQSLP